MVPYYGPVELIIWVKSIQFEWINVYWNDNMIRRTWQLILDSEYTHTYTHICHGQEGPLQLSIHAYRYRHPTNTSTAPPSLLLCYYYQLLLPRAGKISRTHRGLRSTDWSPRTRRRRRRRRSKDARVRVHTRSFKVRGPLRKRLRSRWTRKEM